MAHDEQLAFFAELIRRFPEPFAGKVLDIGSADINGGPHTLISPQLYVGVDLAPLTNVHLICDGAHLAIRDATFDVVMSSECFEHDQTWRQTLANMVRVTRPGGLIAFSAASTGRREHGTTRADGGRYSPASVSRGREWYRNVTRRDVRRALHALGLHSNLIFVERRSCDVYCVVLIEPVTAESRGHLVSIRRVLRARSGPNRHPYRWRKRLVLRVAGDSGINFIWLVRRRLKRSQRNGLHPT